jgi:hypothetical protein
MDWQRAIEINKEALVRIVAALVSLLEAQGVAVRLPLRTYQYIIRTLHPAESAVRRLIVIAARGLVVPVPPVRSMPKGLVIERTGSGRMAFQLFDTRKTFGDVDAAPARTLTRPRIRSIDDASPRELFQAKFAVPGTSSEAETLRARLRLAALKCALDTLPRQAKRMAQWMKRRAMMKSPKFTSPLRPGPPPGLRKRSRDDIDRVLAECHGLAWDSFNPDTS